MGAGDVCELIERHRTGPVFESMDTATESMTPPRSGPLEAPAAARSDWAKPLPPVVETGIEDLDRALAGGFRAESAYVLNGPTGRGKTGMAIQIARHLSRTRPVVFLATELSRRQTLARFAAPMLQRSWLELYELGPEGGALVAGVLEGLHLRVAELERDTVIADLLDRVADEEGAAPILFLDYLQDAARRLNPDDRRIANAALSDEIKRWTRASGSTAVVVSSVARGFYTGNENRSAVDFVGAAKESGDIDFDAAGLLFLDCEPCPPGGTSAARLHVSKSRFSASGMTIGLRFDGALGHFAPDPAGALTEAQRDALDAIRDGAGSVEEVRRKLGVRKEHAGELISVLCARSLVARRPLRVLG